MFQKCTAYIRTHDLTSLSVLLRDSPPLRHENPITTTRGERRAPDRTPRAVHHDVQRVGLVDAALIGFAAFMAAVAIQRGTLKEIGAVSIAMDDKQIVLPGAMAQGIFRKRAESRAERIVERIKTMDPLNR